MDDIGIRLNQCNECRSKCGVLACKLDGKGGEDELEVAPVLEVSGAEERSSESSVGRQPLCDRLRDSGLSSSSQPVQPVNRGLVEVPRPEFDFAKDGGASFFKTTVAVSMSMLRLLCITETVEDRHFSCEGDRVRQSLMQGDGRCPHLDPTDRCQFVFPDRINQHPPSA